MHRLCILDPLTLGLVRYLFLARGHYNRPVNLETAAKGASPHNAASQSGATVFEQDIDRGGSNCEPLLSEELAPFS
jgi:hypothetical protein